MFVHNLRKSLRFLGIPPRYISEGTLRNGHFRPTYTTANTNPSSAFEFYLIKWAYINSEMTPTRIMLLILGVQSILANKDLVLIAEERQQFQVCGQNLASVLTLVCEGNYNGMLSKKSNTGEMDWQRELEQQLETEESMNDLIYQFPFRSKAQAHAFLAPDGVFRRHTRGIVEECCHKPCTKYELKLYCADGK